MGDFVVVFKNNFYFSVPEEICDFPDLWGYISECCPLGVVFGSCGWCCAVYFICYINLIKMLSGKMLLLAISSMVVHPLSWFSLLRGRLNILLM